MTWPRIALGIAVTYLAVGVWWMVGGDDPFDRLVGVGFALLSGFYWRDWWRGRRAWWRGRP